MSIHMPFKFTISRRFAAGVCCLLLLLGCRKADEEHRMGDPLPVMVSVMVEEDIARPVHCTGTVYPVQQAKLSFRYSGRIFRIFTAQGRHINNRETLALLDTELLTQAWVESGLRLISVREQATRLERDLAAGLVSQEEFQVVEDEKNLLVDIYYNAKAALREPALKAPFSGRVIEWFAAEGDSVRGGAPVALFADIDPYAIARVSLSEAEYFSLTVGDDAVVTPQDELGLPLKGKIQSVGLAEEVTGDLYQADIRFENPGAAVSMGARVVAEIASEYKSRCIVIPSAAVVERQGRDGTVFLTDKEGVFAVRRHVELGPEIDHRVIIEKGLHRGERLIVHGQNRLEHGSFIMIMN